MAVAGWNQQQTVKQGEGWDAAVSDNVLVLPASAWGSWLKVTQAIGVFLYLTCR